MAALKDLPIRSQNAPVDCRVMEAVMAHVTLQLGAAVIVPFGTRRRNATDTSRWKERSVREAAAIHAGLPVLPGRFGRYAHLRLMPPVTDNAGGRLVGGET